MQVFRNLPEGTLAELIDGILYMSPAPTTYHQLVIGTLHRVLANFVLDKALGTVFLSPVDVYLDETLNAVQPDLLFISKDSKLVMKRDGLYGAPDLIIEVLSPTNPKHDLVRKKSLYEKFGVKEYWIVDPEAKDATGFELREAEYHPLVTTKSKFHSALLRQEFEF